MEKLKAIGQWLKVAEAKIYAAVFDPKPLKTAGVAAGGFGISFADIEFMVRFGIALITLTILIVHFTLYFTKLWCPARRKRVIYLPKESETICSVCPACGKLVCPFGITVDKDL